ncbi:hypothetical protein ILYODFUR_001620 [Ilyodon furcidens]|uniref:Uncharacterized protein n=1 Tax=Ilyodon furcidens TaxID=33524 RepID=A0ABV0TTQ1_9TELE
MYSDTTRQRLVGCSYHLFPEGENVSPSPFECNVFLEVINSLGSEAALVHGKICRVSAENSLMFLTRNGLSMHRSTCFPNMKLSKRVLKFSISFFTYPTGCR